jgi:hypothetical protein
MLRKEGKKEDNFISFIFMFSVLCFTGKALDRQRQRGETFFDEMETTKKKTEKRRKGGVPIRSSKSTLDRHSTRQLLKNINILSPQSRIVCHECEKKKPSCIFFYPVPPVSNLTAN